MSTPYMQRVNYQPSTYENFFFQMLIFKTISTLTRQIRWAEARLLQSKDIKHKYLLTSVHLPQDYY